MALRKIIFTSFFIILPHILLKGQTGAPLLTHYRENREMENQSWSICRDQNDVMMFANRRGITTFDGQSWGLIPFRYIPGTLGYCSTDKKVYVGCENNYGYLWRDEKGTYHFSSMLTDSSNVGLITKIFFTDSTVVFYGEQSISRHDLKTGTLQWRIFQKKEKPFTGMFITPKNTFINVSSGGLYRLESDTLFPIVTGYLLENEEVLFSLPYNDKMVLLGLGNGSLSLFDGIKFYVYQLRDEGYLKQNGLSDGIAISDSLYAFSTVDGGAIVVARQSGKVRKTINWLCGLPDDEVFAMGTDNNNGLWLSHQYGLTRAELVLPVGNLNMYKGLSGNLISSVMHNNELYVATSEGVFYLSQVKTLTSEDVLVKTDPTVPAPIDLMPAELPVDQLKKQPDQEVQKTRKSRFLRIFGKKPATPVTTEKPVEEKPAEETAKPVSTSVEKPQYVKKTVTRLKSGGFEFVKTEGLNEKCKQLVSTADGILVSTNKGLFLIRDHKAKSLVPDRYIYSISSISPDKKYYAATADGYFFVSVINGQWVAGYPDKNFTQPVYAVVAEDAKTLWAGSDDEVIKISIGDKPVYKSYRMQSDFPLRYITSYENDTLFAFSTAGVCYYDRSTDSVQQEVKRFRWGGTVLDYVISQPEAPWVKQGEDWICLGNKWKIKASDRAILKIFENIVSIVADDRNLWVITGDNQIYKVVLNSFSGFKPELDLYIRSIRNDKEVRFAFSDIVIKPGDNLVYFDIVAPAYLKENSVLYQYKVDKLMDGWSPWQSSPRIEPPLGYGTFTIRVRAKDIWGNISEPIPLTYTRRAPFTKTRLFFVALITVVFSLIIFITWLRERQLKKEKKILEDKVRERTAEIEAQKEEITSSIAYASRIQLAMLPVEEHFAELFPDYFILFKPRDIVSGDFYWIGEDANHIFFTVADCTGHGVPGAFMSTLGVSTLNEIITNKQDLHANTVLNLLREKIKKSLHQTGKEGEAADGMDVSFCILHKNRRSLEYSGAFNPLVIIQNGEVKEYKADRMPIGIYVGEKESFTNFEINVNTGDAVYLFSDGFTDQFGGPYGAKYKKSSLKKLLGEISSKPMAEQKKILENEFGCWKGKGEQIDDITIIGVRI